MLNRSLGQRLFRQTPLGHTHTTLSPPLGLRFRGPAGCSCSQMSDSLLGKRKAHHISSTTDGVNATANAAFPKHNSIEHQLGPSYKVRPTPHVTPVLTSKTLPCIRSPCRFPITSSKTVHTPHTACLMHVSIALAQLRSAQSAPKHNLQNCATGSPAAVLLHLCRLQGC